MAEAIVVNLGEVKERNPLPKAVYIFTFKNSKAYLVRSKKESSDWIGLQGTLIPEGHPDDAFMIWLAVNHGMNTMDAKKFFKQLGYVVDGPGAIRLGGELTDGEAIKAGTAPAATLSVDGKPPIPVGFLKFRGETGHERRQDGSIQPRLLTILGRVE